MSDLQSREWEIDELLHRRTDLSTFVIHWTRDFEGSRAIDNLLGILNSRTIEARTPYGAARRLIENDIPDGPAREAALASQRVACFTESPIEQAWSLVSAIRGRAYKLAPYGLAFTKNQARRMGVNPVWYVDTTRSGHEWLMTDVWTLIRSALQQPEMFTEEPIARIAPFVERMGEFEGGKKEFWWEREWRHLGNLAFSAENVAVVFCPEPDIPKFQQLVLRVRSPRPVPVIDPRWGLEYIIAALSGVPTI